MKKTMNSMRRVVIAIILSIAMSFSVIPSVLVCAGSDEPKEVTFESEGEAVDPDKAEEKDSIATSNDAKAEKADSDKKDARNMPKERGEADDVIETAPSLTIPEISGTWDLSDENIDFGAEGATIGFTGNLAFPEVKKVRIVVKYPAGSTDQILTVKLAEGLRWVNNGSVGTPALDSVSELTERSKIAGVNIDNGKYTYYITSGTTVFTLEFDVKYDVRMDFKDLSDAIIVGAECKKDGKKLEASVTSLKKLTCNRPDEENKNIGLLYYSGIENLKGNININVKQGEVSNLSAQNATSIQYYASESGISRFITYAQITVVADEELEFVKLASNGNSIQTQSTTGFDNNGVPDVKDNGDGTKTYTFTRSTRYSSFIVGFKGDWRVPEDAQPGDVYTARVTKIEYKLYGNDESYILAPTKAYNFKVVDKNDRQDNTYYSAGSITVPTDASIYPVQPIGYYTLNNSGVDPSTPKMVTYDFPEGLNVTGIEASMVTYDSSNAGTMTRAAYRLRGESEWIETAINVKLNNRILPITKADLGLDETARLSGIRLYYDFIDSDGETHYGFKKTNNPTGWCGRIFAEREDGSKNKFEVTISLENLNKDTEPAFNTSNKTEEGLDHTKVVCKLNPTYSDDVVTCFMKIISSGQNVGIAGAPMTLTSTITSSGVSVGTQNGMGANLYPKIYIRDEVGQGISNIKLINNDNVDIIEKHNLTVERSRDAFGTDVYIISTDVLANKSVEEGKYDAAVGYLLPSTTLHNLVVQYDLDIKSDYNDQSTIHKMADAVFVKNSGKGFTRTYSGSPMNNGDVFGVDGAVGSISNDRLYQNSQIQNGGTYIIVSKDDISVSFMAKNAAYDEYEVYNPANPIQVESGADYNVRVTIKNNSGVTTGADEAQTSYIYIPIPKNGDNWGESNCGKDEKNNEINGFGFSMNLNNAIALPEISEGDNASFKIEYAAINTKTSGFENMSSQEVGSYLRSKNIEWGAYSYSANCVRITAKSMKGETGYDFIMNMNVAGGSKYQQENTYNAMFFENLTTQDEKIYSGIYTSDRVGFKVACGCISGIVFADNNGDGVYGAGDELLDGIKVTYTNDNKVKYSAQSDENGTYSFDGVNKGSYTLDVTGYDTAKYKLHEKVATEDIELPQIIDGRTQFDITMNIPLEVKDYSVTFKNDDGTVLSEVLYAYDTAADNIIKPDAPAKEGDSQYSYSFDGWTPEITDAKADAIYTAKYSKTVNKYTIDYVFTDNNECENVVLPGSVSVDYGISYTAEKTASEGYTFSGWYTDETCQENVKYIDGSIIKANIILYGSFTANTYTVSFDANGGEGKLDDMVFIYDKEYDLPEENVAEDESEAEGFVRSGCRLMGWSTSSKAIEPEFEAGEAVKNLASEDGAAVTLYAIWERTDVPVFGKDYYIELDAEEYSEGDPITLTAKGYWPSEAPIKGDIKLVPYDWHHDDPHGDWRNVDDASYQYSAMFTQQEGEYQVHVDFVKSVYGAGGWTESENMVELSADYVVIAKEENTESNLKLTRTEVDSKLTSTEAVSVTKAADVIKTGENNTAGNTAKDAYVLTTDSDNVKNSTDKNVKTGDDTNISFIIFEMILCVLSILCIMFLKKKKIDRSDK